MKTLYESVVHHAFNNPEKIAITSDQGDLTYAGLLKSLKQLASVLPLYDKSQPLAIDIENHAAWAVLDIALMVNHTVSLPIPTFFSDAQILHAVDDAGASGFITDQLQRYQRVLGERIQNIVDLHFVDKSLSLIRLKTKSKSLPESTAKITYTSGTTGNPKGVCLDVTAMTSVASSIVTATELQADNRHLAVLPLATLLENVAGLYANLMVGGTTFLLPSHAVGFNGSQFDIHALIYQLRTTKATTAILMPGMLAQLVFAYESGIEPLTDLRFIAVGGASVAPELLTRAEKVGLPVYEGYGLSESNSVVALNTRTDRKIGSVGKALPHLQFKISAENEILVKGANYLGYIGHPSPSGDWLPTGDIGYVDDEGYLFINGRKKNMFITAYGRNVSPEWLERDLCATSAVQQACVFGEAKPWNIAIIVADADTSDVHIDEAIVTVNHQLPDYARINHWLRAESPFSVINQELTPNGRLKRDKIWQHYQSNIEAVYATEASKQLTARNLNDVLPDTVSRH